MEKCLNVYLDPDFEKRFLTKENGPLNLAIEGEKNFTEAADLNKKAMCQFIQAFPTLSLLSKVNL